MRSILISFIARSQRKNRASHEGRLIKSFVTGYAVRDALRRRLLARTAYIVGGYERPHSGHPTSEQCTSQANNASPDRSRRGGSKPQQPLSQHSHALHQGPLAAPADTFRLDNVIRPSSQPLQPPPIIFLLRRELISRPDQDGFSLVQERVRGDRK